MFISARALRLLACCIYSLKVTAKFEHSLNRKEKKQEKKEMQNVCTDYKTALQVGQVLSPELLGRI